MYLKLCSCAGSISTARRVFTLLLATFIITFVLSCYPVAYGQSKSTYSLLWRISGKELKKPSYLFGTMHVKDKRAFGFSDSVMLALNRTQAFAIEVHPDSMVNSLLGEMSRSDSGSIRKMLGAEDYLRLAKRFEQEKGYPMDEVNALTIENLIQKDRSKPDDKETFVDAYLYGVARTLSKQINGLENVNDQIDLLNEQEDLKERIIAYLNNEEDPEEDEQMDELTRIYGSGNLNDIYNYLYMAEAFDSVLTARNNVMLNSMLRIMKNQSLFTAVGVAHLVGENGLIALLKKEGYTVEAVDAVFTEVADKFKIDESKFAWYNYSSPENGLAFEMPGEPVKKMMDVGQTTVLMYPDLTNEVFYIAYAIPLVPDKAYALPGALKKKVDAYKTTMKGKIVGEKQLVVNGVPAIELIAQADSSSSRIQFELQNDVFYIQLLGNKAENLRKPYADRFFKSVKISKPVLKPAPDWITYNNKKGAFTTRLPVEPEDMSREVASSGAITKNPYFLNMYVAVDNKKLITYLIRYNDFPEGVHLRSNEAAFEGFLGDIQSKATIIGKPEKIYKDGFEGRAFKIKMQEKFNAEVRVYLRGNRQYMLLRQDLDPGRKEHITDDFFTSFKFTPYQQPAYQVYKPDDESYSVDLFSKPRVDRDSTPESGYFHNGVTLTTTNPMSGGVYLFQIADMSPYYQAANIDSVYSDVLKTVSGYQDSVLTLDTITMNGRSGRDVITLNKYTQTQKRHRLLYDDGQFIYMAGFADSKELVSPESNHFFASYKRLKASALKYDLSAKKGSRIFTDLASKDTTLSKVAVGALEYYKLDTLDLPLVYTALKRRYLDDTTYNGTRYKLLKTLTTVSDRFTVQQLDSLYSNPNLNDDLRANILSTLRNVNSANRYDTYINLLTNRPALNTESTYAVFSPLTDSTALAAQHFNALLPLFKHKPYRTTLLALVNDMVTDKDHPEYKKLVQTNYKTVMAFTDEDLEHYLTDTSSTVVKVPPYNYLKLMRELPAQPGTDEFTRKLIKRSDDNLDLLNAARARIASKLPVEQALINRLSDSLYTRLEIMQALYNAGMLSRMPLKLRTPAEFGRACLYNQIGSDNDDAYPQNVGLLGTVTHNGGLYYAYQFDRDEGEGVKRCLGVYGPHKAGAKPDFENYHSYTSYEVKKANWQLQAAKLIKQWKAEQQADNKR